MMKAIGIVIAATVAIPASAKDIVVARRSPACATQSDIDAFYALARNGPSMREVSDFLRDHQCMALKSGEPVTIEQEDPVRLYYCVRVAGRSQCLWVRRDAVKR